MSDLIQRLIKIWKENIKNLYEKGSICSERALQAEIYRQLSDCNEYRIWIEPKLPKVFDYKIPDIIISKSNEIIGIIELKYVPHGAPRYMGDINKLVAFSKAKTKKIPLLTIPNSGGWNEDEKFFISANVLTVFGVIGWHDAHALDYEKWKSKKVELPKNFLHLFGSINESMIEFDGKRISRQY